MALSYRVYELDPGDVASVIDAWQRLAEFSEDRSIFATPTWHRTLADSEFGTGGENLLLAISTGKSVVGIAPLRIASGQVSFCGGSDLVDYHHVLVEKGHEKGVCDALVDYLIKQVAWSEICLTSLRASAPHIALLAQAFRQSGFVTLILNEDVCPSISLPSSWSRYLEQLTQKQRHEVRRKIRRLQRTGRWAFRSHEEGDALQRGLDLFFELQQYAPAAKRVFWNPSRQRFVRCVVCHLAMRSQVRVFTLWLDDTAIAATLCFMQADSWFIYNSAYHTGYQTFSPGFVNHAFTIRQAISERVEIFDFLRGAELYKYDFGAKDYKLQTLCVTNRRALPVSASCA